MMKSALKGMSWLHQFHFSAARHGIVYVKESSSTAEREITLVRDDSWQPSPDELLQLLHPVASQQNVNSTYMKKLR